MSVDPRHVACPTCGKSVEWTPASAWRPFCSERCRMIDLGEWASEKYRVPMVEDKDEPETDSGAPSPPAGGPTNQ